MYGTTIDSDFSFLDGTNCYCAPDSAERIRQAISGMPLDAVHIIGTGDYHYISYFWTERINEPFYLILFDNHPDDQNGAFDSGELSCGNWVRNVRKLPMCKGSLLNPEKLPYEKGSSLYVSIDLDVLSEDYARTNWDQGEMTLRALTETLSDIKLNYNILGVDICGGKSESKGGTQEDREINACTSLEIARVFL